MTLRNPKSAGGKERISVNKPIPPQQLKPITKEEKKEEMELREKEMTTIEPERIKVKKKKHKFQR